MKKDSQKEAGAPDTSASGSAPPETKGWFQQILSKDLPASLVVFLIAIPLSLGIALASGAPVMSGLIAGVVGGIVAGFLGGSPLQVSGPAAGLTLVVFGIIQQFGWPVTCAITIAAGLLQITFGVLRIARAALVISPAVVHGMLAGIGITIALAQLHVILGGTPQSSAVKNLLDLPAQIADLHGPATLLGVLTIGILFAWPYMPAKIKQVPAPLVAVVGATIVSLLTNAQVARVDLPTNLFDAHVLPQMPQGNWGAFFVAALTMALIASVESLLSAVAVDKLHDGPRSKLDRELIGQGSANTISGLLGGLPVTGVIVRSSANVNAGAKTRASAIMHGVWILTFVLLFTSLIEQISLSVLAGLLVFVGVNLVKPRDIRELTHHREASIYFVTVAGVVGLNLLYGVGLGIVFAFLLLLRRLAATHVTIEERTGKYHARIEGSLTFLSVPQLTRELATIPPGSDVDVDLRVDFMDHAAFEALHNWRSTQQKFGGTVDIDETHEEWYAPAAAGRPREAKARPLATMTQFLYGRRRPPVEQDSTIPIAPSEPIVEGVKTFQKKSAHVIRPLMEQLARDGQKPDDMFITCSDSRVAPSMFTSSGPGDLFKLRNIGNLIPPCGCDSASLEATPPALKEDTSVAAAVEFAILVLGIRNIVICGHSNCGAMITVLKNEPLPDYPHLTAWLRHADGSRARFDRGETLDGSLPPVDQLSQINVVQQLENLRTYPVVRDAEASGNLTLRGMYFDIEGAQVYLLNENTLRFVLVDEAMISAPPSKPLVMST